MDARQSQLTQQMRSLVARSSLGSSRVVKARQATPASARAEVLKKSGTLKRDSSGRTT